MLKKIKILIILFVVILLSGCQDWIKVKSDPDDIVFFNINQADGGNIKSGGNNVEADEGLVEYTDEEFLEKYTLDLGRSDSDIKSVRSYTFDLVSDLTFSLQGVDARSSILEFNKDDFIIFRLVNYDYEIDRELVDSMYPNLDNYSIVGGHTNILILEDEKYSDDLIILKNSLRINGQKVFE